jgi:hypothetical protein
MVPQGVSLVLAGQFTHHPRVLPAFMVITEPSAVAPDPKVNLKMSWD